MRRMVCFAKKISTGSFTDGMYEQRQQQNHNNMGGKMSKKMYPVVAVLLVSGLLFAACQPQIVEVDKIVVTEKEVPVEVEKIVEVEKAGVIMAEHQAQRLGDPG